MDRVKIEIAKDIYLDLPAHNCDNLQLTVAIGMLCQMYMAAMLEHDERSNPNVILKNMINAYIDEIYEKLKEGE